jgi:hypothetical protein
MRSAFVSKPDSWGRRALSLATVGYAIAVAFGNGASRTVAGDLAIAMAMAIAWISSGSPYGLANVSGLGLSLIVTAEVGSRSSTALRACGDVGTFAAVAAGCVGLARLPSEGGIVPPRPASPVPAVTAISLAWAGAIASVVGPSVSRGGWPMAHSSRWACFAIVTSACALHLSAEWTRRRRALELDAVQRATAARNLLWALVAAAAAIAPMAPDLEGDFRLALGLSAVAAVFCCVHPSATAVASTARRAIALAIAAGGLALCAVGLAGRGPADARGVATTAILGVVVGSCVPLLESALRAGGGRWLDAFGNVVKRPCGPEPDDTIREALMTLRAPTGLGFASPELWTFAPTTRSTVDAAGYLHRMSAELPAELPRLAAGEPFGVLRSEVLAAVEVRRPDLRYLAEWMEARQVLAASILAHDGEIDGLLVLPRGNRREPMTLTEVRSMRRVADHLAAPCRARMAESTMRTQVLEADTRVTLAERRLNELERERERCAALSSLWTSRLASMASVGAYSAGARLALQSLETRMSLGASVFFVVPGGFDPLPLLARAHLGGPRRQGPFIAVEGSAGAEHDPARWTDVRKSPLALADGGLLAIVDVAALPAEIQEILSRACIDRRPPWQRDQPLDVQFALTTTLGRRAIRMPTPVASLTPTATSPFGLPIVFPRLRERPDDLRALVMDGIAREGLRIFGHPVGIESIAYAKLADYDFPGDVAELNLILRGLVECCEGEKIVLRHVDALLGP